MASPKQLVPAVGGDDLVRIDAVQVRRRRAEGLAGGGRIAAQALDGEARERLGHRGRGRVRVLVGVELHPARGLLAGHVAGEVPQAGALEGAGVWHPIDSRFSSAGTGPAEKMGSG